MTTNLAGHTGKPRTLVTLTGSIRSWFQLQLTEEKVAAIVQELQKQKVIIVEGTKVSYPS